MTFLLALTLVAGIKGGNASRYGYEGDIFDKVGSFACKRTLESKYGRVQWEKMRSRGVAHRTLPCGTRLGICLSRTGLCTAAYVVDRGPWGVLNRKGEWHARTGRLLPGEHYRGELDLLPGTYTALGLVGIERVMYWPIALGVGESAPGETPRRAEYPQLRLADQHDHKAYHDPKLGGLIAPQNYPPLRLADDGRIIASLPPLAGSYFASR